MLRSEVIRGALEDELIRTKRMTACYENELHKLPRGSIIKRIINGNEYYYISYRDGKKVITKYLGKSNNIDIDKLQKEVEERKRTSKLLKELRDERHDLERILGY